MLIRVPRDGFVLKDGRVAWDHGAGGVSGTLLRAALVLHDSKYLDSATKALECIWQKGLLTKGLMNCHGIGGNTYAMFRYEILEQVVEAFVCNVRLGMNGSTAAHA